MREPWLIYKKLGHLEKLEKILLIILQYKNKSIELISSNTSLRSEEISQLLNYLYKFDSKRLTDDLNEKILNDYTVEQSKAILDIFKNCKNTPEEATLSNFIKATSWLLYAVRIELRTEKSNLVVAVAEKENKKQRIYYEHLEKQKLIKKLKEEAKLNKKRLKEEAKLKKLSLIRKRQQQTKNRQIIQNFQSENLSLIKKFVEVTKRKVAYLNEYGYENFDALFKEIGEVIKIMMIKEDKYEIKSIQEYVNSYIHTFNFETFPYPYSIIAKHLEQIFRQDFQANNLGFSTFVDFSMMSGVEFEGYLIDFFRSFGINEICGTQTTGDQGADILMTIKNKRIAIQAKNHRLPVGNSAIQEIVGALKYYDASDGWLITTSTFTKSAEILAQKNKITLFDKYSIPNIKYTIENLISPDI